jgi:hypothetical protein
MNLKGTYVFLSNGEKLFEGENIITTNGSLMINQYLANSSVDWAGTLAIGALGTTSASTDIKLGYEIYRTPITLKSYVTSGSVNQIAIKATIDSKVVAKIYEVGILPLTHIVGAYKDNTILTTFSEQDPFGYWQTGPSESSLVNATYNTASSRVDPYNISASSTSVTSKTNFYQNLSNFNTNDFLQLLYAVTASGTSPSLTVVLSDSASNTWTSQTVVLSTSSVGYYSASLAMPDSPTSGFNYNLNKIKLTLVGGTGSIQYDALKFMSGATLPPELKLVSRKSSTTPIITKTAGQPVDIEYYLTVT